MPLGQHIEPGGAGASAFRNRFRRGPQVAARHVLSIASTGHGASMAYVAADGTVRAGVLDRYVAAKHTLLFAREEAAAIVGGQTPIDTQVRDILAWACGRLPPIRLFEEVVEPWFEHLLGGLGVTPADVDLLVLSDSYFATCSGRLGPELRRFFPHAQVVGTVEHHEAHQRQAFWQSGFPSAAVLTLDTCGENLDRVGGGKLAGTIARFGAGGEIEVFTELGFPESSAGLLYSIVNHHVGFRQGDEGKTMGLAPYGSPALWKRLAGALELRADGGFRFLDYRELERLLGDYVPARDPAPEAPMTELHMDVAYAGQALIEAIVANAFEAALRLTGERRIAYAGGVALNSVANEIAIRRCAPEAAYMAPNSGDTGQALGCALLGAHEIAGWPAPAAELGDSLGPPLRREEVDSALAASSGTVTTTGDPWRAIARCIANGHVVARCAGGSEFGPRALGNRSILFDPRRADGKDYLNARVKHREGFRPYAPVVLAELASEWFEMTGDSRYMLRVVPVRPGRRDRIPAVTHVDGTARVQTVEAATNPGLRRIVEEFHAITGVPLLLNTSFNVAGKPIVETAAQAVECFEQTAIDVLLLGDRILSKEPLHSYLENAR